MKYLLLSLLISVSGFTFAQADEGLMDGTLYTSNNLQMDYISNSTIPLGTIEVVATIFMVIFFALFYVILPIAIYCIGSYSLSQLDKHYQKVNSSGISWVPFARYYHIVKNATKSSKKAFNVTILPTALIIVGIILGSILVASTFSGLIDKNSSMPFYIVVGIIILWGFILAIIMHFWRAFIIKKYVKGDTTTALGLSTYTSVVLWYIALDRTTGKTDIIGKIGFVALILFVIIYIGMAGIVGVSALIDSMNSI